MTSENPDGFKKAILHRNQYVPVPIKEKQFVEAPIKDKERDENVIISTKRGVFHQVLVTSAVLLLAAACGMPIGYSAVLLPQLYNSTESISIDIEMGSWIASVHSLSTPIGSLISGSIADRFGRRTTLLVCILPLLAGWVTLATANSYFQLLVGRVVSGASVGILGAPAQIIIAEFSEPKLRGMLIGAPGFSYSLGVLVVYIMGTMLHWRHVAWCSFLIPLVASLPIYLIPESPYWLVRNGQVERARKALLYLRGRSDVADEEVQEIVQRYEEEKLETKPDENIFKLCCEPSALKPLIISNGFNFLFQTSGTLVVIFYAVDIIADFGGKLDSPQLAVSTSACRLIIAVLMCVFLLFINRRTIILTSGIGSGLACLALGLFLVYKGDGPKSENEVILALSLMVVYIAFNTPMVVICGIIVGELLPTKIRGRVAGWIYTANNILMFALTKTLPLMQRTLHTSGVFFIFGAASFGVALFSFLLVPETKNKKLSEIEDYFRGSNWLWQTRPRTKTVYGEENERVSA